MSKKVRGLTAAEAERLAFLAKEMGSAIQIVGQVFLHGYHNEPSDDYDSTNREFLQRHLGNVKLAIDLMCSSSDINAEDVQAQSERKARMLKTLLHHQGGTI